MRVNRAVQNQQHNEFATEKTYHFGLAYLRSLVQAIWGLIVDFPARAGVTKIGRKAR